jgi:hypothetical protein
MAIKQDPTHPTGVVATTKPGSELNKARDRKASAALAMKLGGADWDEIARALGYPNDRAVITAVELALGRQLNQLDRNHLRLLAAGRLESLVRSSWKKAHTEDDPEHLAAIKTTRETVESLVRLWGLNAPQEILVTNPTQEMLDQWVGRVVSTNLPQVTEADIVDAEDVQEVS